ncbi:hypothetical protein K504DRAFT_135710 [Pleomassaria siparia CBS 279.74]|uniref:Uncharacterized protein n=1 Tax=Pleomassaria siparia CBS 279.74 TaxID=1314801 RepID=A0A6G1KL52_9PLEO|nr:hypothetical protein K504DRAFT_135710 [Pleomassaria siparia CBS 279.74]
MYLPDGAEDQRRRRGSRRLAAGGGSSKQGRQRWRMSRWRLRWAASGRVRVEAKVKVSWCMVAAWGRLTGPGPTGLCSSQLGRSSLAGRPERATAARCRRQQCVQRRCVGEVSAVVVVVAVGAVVCCRRFVLSSSSLLLYSS